MKKLLLVLASSCLITTLIGCAPAATGKRAPISSGTWLVRGTPTTNTSQPFEQQERVNELMSNDKGTLQYRFGAGLLRVSSFGPVLLTGQAPDKTLFACLLAPQTDGNYSGSLVTDSNGIKIVQAMFQLSLLQGGDDRYLTPAGISTKLGTTAAGQCHMQRP